MAMEKNAVLGSNNIQQMIKTASRGCPICGSQLDTFGSLPRCPSHGTAPFEAGVKLANSRQDPFKK
jgi:hypothetical protein